MKKIRYALKYVVLDGKMQITIPLMVMILSILVVLFSGMESYDKTKEKLIEGIKNETILMVGSEDYSVNDIENNLSDVKAIHQIKYIQTKNNEEVYSTFVYDYYMIERINYNIYKGTQIKNENEILISKKLADEYDVGDEINLCYRLKDGTENQVVKKVCGIIDDDIVLFSNVAGNLDYSMLLTEVNKDSFYLPEYIVTIDAKMANTDENNYKVCYLEAEREIDEEMINQWTKETLQIGRIYRGEDLLVEAKEARQHTNNNSKLFILSSMVLGIIIFMGIGIVSTVKYMKETGILLLCGANRGESFFVQNICKLILGLLGFILGNLFAIYLLENGFILGRYEMIYSIYAFLASVFIYAVAIVISNVALKKYSINELIKITKG